MDTFIIHDKFGDELKFTKTDTGVEVATFGPRGGMKSYNVLDKAQTNALRWFLAQASKDA